MSKYMLDEWAFVCRKCKKIIRGGQFLAAYVRHKKGGCEMGMLCLDCVNEKAQDTK